MSNNITHTLTNTKLAFGVLTPIIGVLFLFFSMQSDIKANAEDLQRLQNEYTEVSVKVDDISKDLNLLRTDVRVIMTDISYLAMSLERIETQLENK